MRWLSPLLPAVCALAFSVGCAAEADPDIASSHQEVVTSTPTSFLAVGTILQDQNHFYTVSLPDGATAIVVDLDGDGDADLYSRIGAAPDVGTYDCRPYLDGSDELCFHLTAAGELGLMVRGWAPVSDYELSIIWEGIGTSPGPKR